MRFTSCEAILEDFFFLRNVIMKLDDDYFSYMTKEDIQEEKALWIEECKMDYSFKLLTKIEANIRLDFNRTFSSKFRDPLSKKYVFLCDAYRQRKHDYAKHHHKLCQRIPLDEIFQVMVQFFKSSQNRFYEQCSTLKGYFKFRHWYAHGRHSRITPIVPDPEDLAIIYDNIEMLVLARRQTRHSQ